MEPNSQQAYLETQVMTATPQKLRLMMIDGAIRFAHQTIQYWEEENHEDACESLIRCRGVITELLCAIRQNGSEVIRKMAGIYLYIFQQLSDVQLHQDREKMSDVIKVLQVERETWQKVCEEMPEAPDAARTTQLEEITASNIPAIPPINNPSAAAVDYPPNNPAQQNNGFSLEA